MDESYLADFANGRERGNFYGQTTDNFGNIGQYSDLRELNFPEPILPAQNKEDSKAMVQPRVSVPEATVLVSSPSMPNQDTSHQSKPTKAQKDKAYRERLKKRKIEMEGKMESLTQENKVLKDQNGHLQRENTHMNKVMQSQAKEINQLKNDLHQLKHEYMKQSAFVQTLSDILANSDLRLKEENLKLQNEIDLLRQITGMGNPSSQIVEENLTLKRDKMVMKVQIDALCEKLIRAKIGQ